ncbi:MAG: hypothetical protein HY049_01220 [Acidobacteria bacterium]|nr:hypothetical protein [Acidobacteriota bacterium]
MARAGRRRARGHPDGVDSVLHLLGLRRDVSPDSIGEEQPCVRCGVPGASRLPEPRPSGTEPRPALGGRRGGHPDGRAAPSLQRHGPGLRGHVEIPSRGRDRHRSVAAGLLLPRLRLAAHERIGRSLLLGARGAGPHALEAVAGHRLGSPSRRLRDEDGAGSDAHLEAGRLRGGPGRRRRDARGRRHDDGLRRAAARPRGDERRGRRRDDGADAPRDGALLDARGGALPSRGEGLQADPGVLQRRAHGNPERRGGDRRHRALGRALPRVEQRSHQGRSFSGGGKPPPHGGGAHRGRRCGAGLAIAGLEPHPRRGDAGDHRVPAVRAVLQRVGDPPFRDRWASRRRRGHLSPLPASRVRRAVAPRVRDRGRAAPHRHPIVVSSPPRHVGGPPAAASLPARVGVDRPGPARVAAGRVDGGRPASLGNAVTACGEFELLTNGASLPWARIPEWPVREFVDVAASELDRGGRLCALFGVPEGAGGRLVCVAAFDADNTLAVGRSEPIAGSYPSLTKRHAQAHLFEREILEQIGLEPAGHPWLKPVRRSGGTAPATAEFFRVEGGEIHEVAVGPVHAGVIEPGHFRFQCDGERVLHLEIALGYQHRGVERALVGGPHRSTLAQMETVAGDSTIAHATAHAMVAEALGESEAPLRAQWLRALALELERLANHTGDLGALAGDVAFLPTSAACGRLRGDFLNLTALVGGSRFGRGLVVPGGFRRDVEPPRSALLLAGLRVALSGVEEAMSWLWDSGSVRSRFEGTGALSAELAEEIGLVGVAARASGLVRDVRFDHPAGWHRFASVPVSVWPGGDVLARGRVRWLEIQRTGAFLEEQLRGGPEGDLSAACGEASADTLAAALVEGWRGEVCHVALTDARGRFRRYKIVDPSFHNWTGVAMAMRDQAVSDFPLCNKSFNLSYCGFDL